MATLDVSIIDKFNVANKRVHVVSLTADAAEQNVDTGLDFVDHFILSAQSGTTAAAVAYANVNSTGTASNGKIGISGAVDGDVYFIYAFGR